MTALQIQYHNLAEQQRANLAKEQQARNQLQEEIRHNKVVEMESNRHNLVAEDQNRMQAWKDGLAGAASIGRTWADVNKGVNYWFKDVESGTASLKNIASIIVPLLG